MIRFRNPSSSLETMISSFELLYSELNYKDSFNNDDIAKVLSKGNLMASSGFTGEQALQRGANKDRSRDKTYNNAKMFAEMFRLLGLISIVNSEASNYRFTYIAEHFVLEKANRKPLICQCILGINNPNKIIDVSYSESIRFFACLLLSMKELDGIICRDEIILGPMCVDDNNSNQNFLCRIRFIKSIRGNFSRLEKELEKLASSLTENKKEGMSVTSVQNCTRFPISVLKYCNWVDEISNKEIYGKKIKFLKLNANGEKIIDRLKLYKDIRLSDYESIDESLKKSLIRLGVYQMLEDANFDISQVENQLNKDKKICSNLTNNKSVLFSPYQTLELEVVNEALGIKSKKSNLPTDVRTNCITPKNNLSSEENMPQSSQLDIIESSVLNRSLINDNVKSYVLLVKKLYKENGTINSVSDIITKLHIGDKKVEFYPFIETLFRVIGLDCHKSRDGVNGERWDAIIKDPLKSIPAEIKSPTEELHISVKAIRQALENKIVLLSRKTYKTTENISSFAIGYFLPNERAEVATLIEDIKKTFGYKIAVFDIKSLIRISVNIIVLGKGVNLDKLYEVEGIVNVSDIEF